LRVQNDFRGLAGQHLGFQPLGCTRISIDHLQFYGTGSKTRSGANLHSVHRAAAIPGWMNDDCVLVSRLFAPLLVEDPDNHVPDLEYCFKLD
jgi:hypothetical protein